MPAGRIVSPPSVKTTKPDSLVEILNKKRESLSEYIRTNKLFDESSIKSFNDTKQKDGSYQISPSDSIIIKNAKILNNLLLDLEKLLPVIENLIQQDTTLGVLSVFSKSGSGLMGNVGYIMKIINDIYELNFYAQQLMKEFSDLPVISEEIEQLLAECKQLVQGDVAPWIEKISERTNVTEVKEAGKECHKTMMNLIYSVAGIKKQSANESNLLQGVKHIGDAFGKMNDAVHEVTSLDAEFRENEIKSIFGKMKNFANNISKLSHAEKDVRMGVDEIRKAINSMLNFDENDMNTLIQIGFEELEIVLAEMVKQLDVIEGRLGVRDGAFLEKIEFIYKKIEKHAQDPKNNIKLKKQFPFLAECYDARRSELAKENYALNQLEDTRKFFSNNLVSINTSLDDLIELKQRASIVPTLELYNYIWYLDNQIKIMTGLHDLNADIAQLETAIVNGLGDLDEMSAELKQLYQMRVKIENRIEGRTTLDDRDASAKISYNKSERNLKSEFREINNVPSLLNERKCERVMDRVIDNQKSKVTKFQQRLDDCRGRLAEQISSASNNVTTKNLAHLKHEIERFNLGSYDGSGESSKKLKSLMILLEDQTDPTFEGREKLIETLKSFEAGYSYLSSVLGAWVFGDNSALIWQTVKEQSINDLNRLLIGVKKEHDKIEYITPEVKVSEPKKYINETPDELYQRLKAESVGALTLAAEAARGKILDGLNSIDFEDKYKKALSDRVRVDGLYIIDP